MTESFATEALDTGAAQAGTNHSVVNDSVAPHADFRLLQPLCFFTSFRLQRTKTRKEAQRSTAEV